MIKIFGTQLLNIICDIMIVIYKQPIEKKKNTLCNWVKRQRSKYT